MRARRVCSSVLIAVGLVWSASLLTACTSGAMLRRAPVVVGVPAERAAFGRSPGATDSSAWPNERPSLDPRRAEIRGEVSTGERSKSAVIGGKRLMAELSRALRIYGTDGRCDVGSRSSPRIAAQAPTAQGKMKWAEEVRERAKSIALVVTTKDLEEVPGDCVRVKSAPYRDRIRKAVTGKDLCGAPLVRFADQPTAGFCTAWLVADRVVVTAGHCTLASSATDLAFVFDWREGENEALPGVVPSSRVFYGERYIARGIGAGADFAVIQLDRPAKSICPLTMRRRGAPEPNEPLYILGCPRGLPVKFAGDARVQAVHTRFPLLLANIDAFSGNSGSPVLSARDHSVVGILVRGRSDFILDGPPPGCVAEIRVPDTVRGETVLGCVAFAHFIR